MATTTTIWRLPQALADSGKKRSSLYGAIKAGLWTRPVKLSARAVGWPAHECQAITAARIAGKSDEQIRLLVQKLEMARREAA